MIGTAKILAVIPARGGSKGIARKNIRPVAGKPLIAWTIEAAQATPEIDRLILSSEDEEIITTARLFGCECPFPRPLELAQDNSTAIEVALHLLANLQEQYDYLVWLQPTSPLRTPDDILACMRLCVHDQTMSVVSVSLVEKNPGWMFYLDETNTLSPVLPLADHTRSNRQQLPQAYALNGAVYVTKIDWLLQSARFMDQHTKAYIMPPERSVDIDSQRDLLWAEWLLSKQA